MMNQELLTLGRAVAVAASKLPPEAGLELIREFLEYAGDVDEVVSLRNAYVQMYAGRDQLELFTKDAR